MERWDKIEALQRMQDHIEDGIGLKDSTTSISFYACPKPLEEEILTRAKEIVGMEQIEP